MSDTHLTHVFVHTVHDPCLPMGRCGGWSDVELAHLVHAWIYASEGAIIGIDHTKKVLHHHFRGKITGLLAAYFRDVNNLFRLAQL